MAKTIVLADYRWILYRSSFRFNEFQVEYKGTTLKTGAIYGVLEFVKTVVDNYDKLELYFCLDGEPKERLALLPSYKEKRHEADPKDEIAHARALHDEPIKILSVLDKVHFIKDQEKEADDLIAELAFRELGKGNQVIVFTGDKDMLQLMQFGIKISKSIENGKLEILRDNYITLHKDLGVAPEELLYFRALEGDKSDEIPAAMGGNKEFKRAVAAAWYKSNDRYLEHFDQLCESLEPVIEEMFKGKKARNNNRENLKSIKENAIRNIKLMELDKYKPIYEAYKAYKETQNKDIIKEVKEKYLSSIKIIDYDMDSTDVVKILQDYDLQRFLAWLRHNSYI